MKISYLVILIQIVCASTKNFQSKKIEDEENASWKCECDSEEQKYDRQCRCSGVDLVIPDNLGDVSSLLIFDSNIIYLRRDDFRPYHSTLTEVVLSNLPYLRVIEAGTFRDMPNLRTLYITEAKELMFVPGLLEGVNTSKFLSLRIVQTSLMEVPDFSHLNSENILHLIDLDANKIDRLRANSFQVNAEQVTLNYNEISEIEDGTFNGSQIGILSLKGNRQLKQIQKKAFAGTTSLRELDFSETSIKSMPTIGLSELEVLKIQDTPSLKIIPSIYDFPNLQKAFLTHHFHCCAFKYPEQHNPQRHAQYENTMREVCKDGEPQVDTGQLKLFKRKRKDLRVDFEFMRNSIRSQTLSHIDSNDEQTSSEWSEPNFFINVSSYPPLRGDTIEVQVARDGYYADDDEQGVFHDNFANVSNNKLLIWSCGNFSTRSRQIQCYPEPNALNPCEDIMGSYYLRISVWFVVIFALTGNLAVVIVVLFSGGEITVSRFLICNLAMADLCMGVYLMAIASMDFHSVGSYFNYAFDWQYGVGCKIAGFLTMFASQLSIFTLTVLTVERWFAITYAIHLTRRIRLGVAAKIMAFGWMYSIIMSTMPLFGVSNYGSTSICLPMEANMPVDKAYLISIIVINGLAFSLIVFCYAQIYFSLGYETRRCSTKGEMTIAKKMALLVFTDFVCWAPIAFFALTALAGYPLIGVTKSKILLVFFYPLNSCANPYLYAIMTAQYRKDFFVLLYKCGICTKKAKQYVFNSSIPTTNHTHPSHPVPLLSKTSQSAIKANNVEDAYV